MIGNPGVATFTHEGREQIYAFVRGGDGRLYVCFWDARPGVTSWRWADQGRPPQSRVNSSPTVLSSVQDDRAEEHFLHAFVRGDDGELYENSWNGSVWSWARHGKPAWNIPLVKGPGLIAYRRTFYLDGDEYISDSNDQLFAFCWGSDDRLYRLWQDTGEWRLQGRMPGAAATVSSEPAVARHPRPGPFSFVHAYVVGSDERLYVNFSTTLQADLWTWRDLGQPGAGSPVTRNIRPAVISHPAQGRYRLFAFIRAGDGRLWAHDWGGRGDSTAGNWIDLGAPPGTAVSREPSVVSYTHEGQAFMYVFVRGANGHLHVCRWDGAGSPLWSDLGRPTPGGRDTPAGAGAGQALVASAPGAVTFLQVEPGGESDRIYAFVRGGDDRLHTCYWNGVDLWLWSDLGAP